MEKLFAGDIMQEIYLFFSKIHDTPMLTFDTDFPPKYTRRLKHKKLCHEFAQIFFELKICELNYLVP